jgi:hypothetical protein
MLARCAKDRAWIKTFLVQRAGKGCYRSERNRVSRGASDGQSSRTNRDSAVRPRRARFLPSLERRRPIECRHPVGVTSAVRSPAPRRAFRQPIPASTTSSSPHCSQYPRRKTLKAKRITPPYPPTPLAKEFAMAGVTLRDFDHPRNDFRPYAGLKNVIEKLLFC